MRVHYIFHSGFLVETERSYYLFDYYRGEIPKLAIDKPIIVFFSHAHRDHYNPEVVTLLLKMGMQSILCVLSKDIPASRYPSGAETLKVYAQKTYDLPGGETLQTLLSTDQGVAFLLTTPEGTIFHAGDLNDWTWDGEPEADNKRMCGAYRREIDKLRGTEIDAAFIPLDPRLDMHYADGLLYFLSAVSARNVYPMHYWAQPEIIRAFLAENPTYRSVVRNTEEARQPNARR